MKDRAAFYRAISHVAWAYLFLHLNINLGSLNILPDWVGYLLILSALNTLGEEEPSAPLLRPLGELLALWEGVRWVMALLGREVSLYPVDLVAGILALYFHFQLLTNLAQIARRYPPPGESVEAIPGAGSGQPSNPPAPLWKRLLRLRTARTLLITVSILVPVLFLTWSALAITLVAAHLVVAILLMSALFRLRRSFAPTDENGGTPTPNDPLP